METGESDQACAIRELCEETGLTLAQLQPECECVIHYSIEIQQHTLERTIIYFLGEVHPGTVKIDPDEHSEFCWVGVEEARRLLAETSPEQLPVLEAVLAYLA